MPKGDGPHCESEMAGSTYERDRAINEKADGAGYCVLLNLRIGIDGRR